MIEPFAGASTSGTGHVALPIARGDRLRVLHKTTKKWWIARVGGRIGLVPAGHVAGAAAAADGSALPPPPPPVADDPLYTNLDAALERDLAGPEGPTKPKATQRRSSVQLLVGQPLSAGGSAPRRA